MTHPLRRALCISAVVCVAVSILIAAVVGIPRLSSRWQSADVATDSDGSDDPEASTSQGQSGDTGTTGTEDSSSQGRAPSGDVSGQGSDVSSYTSELALPDEAERILRGYEEDGSCLLMDAGYLDLFGGVWSCTVQGDGWVDVCLVSETDEGRSDVRVIRMDAEEWGRSYDAE